MRIIGIDPGLSGAAFFYDTETFEFRSYKLISKDGKISAYALSAWMFSYHPDHVFIEKIFLTGREGGQSAMTIGANYGRIMAAIESCEFNHTEITPKTWQSALGLKGGSRAIVKEEAMKLAVQRFTLMPFLFGKSKKPHDGCTDAACIALYGELYFKEKLWLDTKKKSTKSTRNSAQNTETSAKKNSTLKPKKSKCSKTSMSKSRNMKGKLKPT